ncbi:MAG TPA: rRNA maturation RNase YbeY [Tissierellia bacterium]|nr:rRNA maturation RNase YbeY [Tissierellia bacterium]
MDILVSSDVSVDEEDLSLVQSAVQAVLEIECLTGEGEVSLLFVDDESIRELNREHRGVDAVTDVLSFPQYDTMEDIQKANYLLLGDVVINLARCKEQAALYGHSVQREVAYLTIHSMYHLLGYDHENPTDQHAMRKKEERAFALMMEEK